MKKTLFQKKTLFDTEQKSFFFKRVLRNLFLVYRYVLSPMLFFLSGGGRCRFHPSCSEYAEQAFLKEGFWRGGKKTLWRLFRCHPWARGGDDPP